MKPNTLIIFIITIVIFCCSFYTTNNYSQHLFKIIENGKFGFINETGEVIIKPKFISAGEFSEGLASARINGYYGYIDEEGNFSIQPQFDYATFFSEGLAVVYKQGSPFYINKQGEKVFDLKFTAVENFNNGRAKVQTASNKYGYINKQGKLVIDTAFHSINPFIDGLAVVRGVNHQPYSEKDRKKNLEIGVIDSLGNFIIPYGPYEDIQDVENGYFRVDIPAEPWDTIDGFTSKTGFVDINGNLIFSRDHNNSSWISGNLKCGLAKMSLYKYWLSEEDGVSYTSEKSYDGFINLKGEIAINDTNYKNIEEFSDNRAFVKKDNWAYSIINTKGSIISRDTYSRINEQGFKNGVAFVAVDWKWGLIDTNGNYVIKPKFEEIDEAGLIDDYFFYKESSKEVQLSGIAKKDGSIILNPIMQQYDKRGFQNNLLQCIIDNKLTYINKQGKIIWQEVNGEEQKIINLNIDYMNRGYFYAHSTSNKHDLGGFGGSDNDPKSTSKSLIFPPDIFTVVVDLNTKDTISGRYNATPVFIVNNLTTALNFNAQDSRLYMKVQALDKNGEWKDIEYLPSSWCGNSYHTLSLEPHQYWKFLTPVYQGEFKTKLRIELKYIDPKDESDKFLGGKEVTIYSNEFDGSINPGQFWRKREYYPNGLMDSYND